MKDIKVFLEKKIKKNDNIVLKDTKIPQQIKKKNWVSI